MRSSSTLPSVLTLLALVGGCTNEFGGTETLEGILVVSPGLTDVLAQPIGLDHRFTIKLSATRADVKVTDLNVLNIDGAYFSSPEYDPTDTDGDDADNPTDGSVGTLFTVPKDGAIDVEVSYFPLREGYHRAQVQVGNDGEGGEITVEVRGRATTPESEVFPWVIDFGSVAPFTTSSELLVIDNTSDLPLVISGMPTTDSQFFTPETFPRRVEPNSRLELEVSVTPIVAQALNGALSVEVGSEQLRRVILRVNDCANGSPAAYNVDNDGFTVCGGDCDDTNDSVSPAGVETQDGLDNDCNGLTDDTTRGYDDDGDGYCDHPTTCIDPAVDPGDCADDRGDIHPAAAEVLGDGIDNNCDGQVDGGTADFDNDGYTEAAGDCAPYDPTVYPGAPEAPNGVPDGIDNDCDAVRDEGTVLADDDGDGWCEGLGTLGSSCTDGTLVGDCNDSDTSTYQGAPELADWRDNDCDGSVDEGTANADDDGDGYTESAVPPDCNDNNPNIGPASLEVPGNGVDDDCDPSTPSGAFQ